MSEPRFNAELDIHLDGGRTATQNRTATTANETIYIIALNENRAKEVLILNMNALISSFY
jgi:hypothetical protein